VNLIAKDPFQRKLEIANWIILAILFVPSFIFTSQKFYLGVLMGGFISILNFHGMAFGLRGLFTNLTGNVKQPTMIKYYIRLIITGVILYLLLVSDTVNVVGLLIGLSVVVINMVITVITTLAKKNFIEEVG